MKFFINNRNRDGCFPEVRWMIIAALLVLSFPLFLSAQPLSLDTCIARAYRRFEFQKQSDLAASVTEKNVSRIEKQYLPSLDLNAMSSYQNTQIEIPIGVQIPNYTPPSVPLYANTALLELRQWIYDGSMVHHSSMVEEAQGNVSQLEVASAKLELKTQVMQRFFSVLLTDKQLTNLHLRDTVLNTRFGEVSTAVANNIVLPAERDLLQAEIIKVGIAITNTEYSRREQLHALGELMGETLADNTQLQTPDAQLNQSTTIDNRPDVRLINGQIDLLEARKGMISSAYLPKIGLYGDLGIGYPGYNIFDKDPALMAKVGITFNWRIFDWDQGAVQEESIDLSKALLGVQRERISVQARVVTKSFLDEISKTEELMKTDKQLLDLYTSVTAAYASKLKNGTITSAEYVDQLTKQEEARVDSDLHELQRLIAIINYNTAMGL